MEYIEGPALDEVMLAQTHRRMELRRVCATSGTDAWLAASSSESRATKPT
jgi:hypothetical protein